ncbi:MAG: S8 family serine peptidase [Vicinamibacterales bacterium]
MNRFVVGIIACGALVMALAGPTLSTPSGVSIPPELAGRVAAKGSASVIVGVSAPFAPEGRLTGAAGIDAQRRGLRASLDDVMGRASAKGIRVGGRFDTVPYFTARVGPPELQALAALPGVVSIHENELFTAQLADTVPLVNAPAAWAAGASGSGWTVAVIDTGIDKAHPFLAGKVTSEACYSGAGGTAPPGFSSVCPGGVFESTAFDSGVPCTPEPLCAHGTAAAGIATGINGTSGLSGVAHQANLISIQVTTRVENCIPGGIPCLMFTESDLIRALERVLVLAGPGNANRIAAVSTSVGNGRFLSQASCDVWFAPMKAAIDNLRSLQIPTIVPAGNNSYTDGLIAPACISSAVTVSATTKADTLSWFSNRAPFLSLLAPGGDGTQGPGSITTSMPGGGFGLVSGTSFAAPHVAGAWAILKQVIPGASVSQVLSALRNTGAPIADAGTARAYPRINVDAARQALLSGVPGPPGPPGTPAVLGGGNFVSLSWPAPVSGGTPAGYTVRARLTPGGPIVASVPVGETLSLDLTAPNGTFIVSVQASNAAGTGPESPSQTLTVPIIPAPPGPPSGLAAVVAGSSVHLFWTPPTTGGEPVGYLIVAALTPGGTPVAGLTFEAPSWWTTIPGVPPGTYYLRLAAFNLGGVSSLSNEVAASVAAPQLPGPPALNAPIVTGNTVNLSWTPGPGDTPSSYIVRASLTPGGPVIAGLPVVGTGLSVPGVPRGTYFIVVQGVTGAGVGPPSNQVTAVVP